MGGDGALTVRDTAFLQAAELQVSGDLVLRAGTFLIDRGSEETRGSGVMASSGGFGGSSKRTWNYLTITQIPSLIDVGGDVTLEATDGNGVIRASTVAGERVSISAEAGAVRSEGAYDTDFYQETKTGENFAFTSASDKGREERVLVASRIDARETLEVTARDGIVVQYPAGLDLDGTIEVFGDTPALAWMQTLRARDDVDWQAMNEVYREWDHESFGLSGPAAAVVAIAVAAATNGLGNQFAVGVLGLAEGSAAALAAQAGFTTPASQAAISLINNQGDLGAVLSDLGSSANLRALASAIVTAGVLQTAGLTVDASSLGENIQNAALRGAVKASIEVGIDGRSPGEAITGALLGALAQGIGAEIAGEIGEAYTEAAENGIDPFEFALHKALHAGLGCGLAAAGGGDCASGAVGGAAGAVFTDIFFDPSDEVAELAGEVAAGRLTNDEMLEQLGEWQRLGVDMTQLAGALAVFALTAETGGDVADGGNTAANVAENNALETVWDLASLAMSLNELRIAVADGDTLDILLAGGAVILDAGAVAAIGIPGGAGAVLKAKREGGKLVAKVEPTSPSDLKLLTPPTSIGSARRLEPGVASHAGNLPRIAEGDAWLRGTSGNAGRFPGQVADQLAGREFRDFNHFRGEFWMSVANDPILSRQFSRNNLGSGLIG